MVGTGFSCMCDGSNDAEKSKNKNEGSWLMISTIRQA
jgi:hypothetical protein